jgi:hypothetical protein
VGGGGMFCLSNGLWILGPQTHVPTTNDGQLRKYCGGPNEMTAQSPGKFRGFYGVFTLSILFRASVLSGVWCVLPTSTSLFCLFLCYPKL